MRREQIGKCDDERCPGWAVFECGGALEIERCDTCKVFDDDDEAEQAALMWLQMQIDTRDSQGFIRGLMSLGDTLYEYEPEQCANPECGLHGGTPA